MRAAARAIGRRLSQSQRLFSHAAAELGRSATEAQCEVVPEPAFLALLAEYDAVGGVLDFIFLEAEREDLPERLHREAALAAMAAIDRHREQWAARLASNESPVEVSYRIHWDEIKLIGRQVSLAEFWGADDVELKPLGNNAWSLPTVDGYKTAFFHPPHSLQGSVEDTAKLFAAINHYVLGDDPERAVIFSWSTDWSDYFQAGHEWWGAFYWTVRPVGSPRFVVVAASTTD